MWTPAKKPSLLNLTGHLNGHELRMALCPAAWAPVYLDALRVTLVEKAELFYFASPSPSVLLNGDFTPTELIDGLLHDELFSWSADARSLLLQLITVAAAELWSVSHGTPELFIELVLKYLTVYTFTFASETTTVESLYEYNPQNNLSLHFNGQVSFFNPSIAVYTSDRAPILTVVTPSRQHGNPNCQVVGYLLAVAQKYFSLRVECAVYRPLLIRLASGSLVYFVTAIVTREYIDSVENGMVGEKEGGFPVWISDVFDLKFITERARFVHALTGIYKVLLDREVMGHLPHH
ncbi:hypothetical protein HOY80DRAFT_1013188 [Tuber brumale]|nr:hypothetical protein HOY80DRAFT_1013188 [Tuber brumale]